MLDDDRARQQVAAHLGHDEFELEPFGAGWHVRRVDSGVVFRTAGTLVIERDSGHMLQFPSFVPTGRVLREFDEVRVLGHEVG